ncbi:MAG: hypothetical protein ACKVZ0_12370 [Gemmatimonadales bacterium]
MKRSIAIILALVSFAVRAEAQPAEGAGTVALRIWRRDAGRLDGSLVRRDSSWLVVRPAGSIGTQSVHREEILRIERFSPNAGIGAGTAALIGAAGGFGIGLVIIKVSCAIEDCSEAGGVGVLAPVIAALGGLLGLATYGGDDWVPVAWGNLAVGQGGVGFAIPTNRLFR